LHARVERREPARAAAHGANTAVRVYVDFGMHRCTCALCLAVVVVEGVLAERHDQLHSHVETADEHAFFRIGPAVASSTTSSYDPAGLQWLPVIRTRAAEPNRASLDYSVAPLLP